MSGAGKVQQDGGTDNIEARREHTVIDIKTHTKYYI